MSTNTLRDSGNTEENYRHKLYLSVILLKREGHDLIKNLNELTCWMQWGWVAESCDGSSLKTQFTHGESSYHSGNKFTEN